MFAVAVGFRDPEDENQPTIAPKLRRPLEDVITEEIKTLCCAEGFYTYHSYYTRYEP